MFTGGAVDPSSLGASLALTQTTLLSGALFLGGAAVLVTPLIIRHVRRWRVGKPAPPSVQERAGDLSRLARDRAALESLMKDVRELTRLCAQQLDARAEKLERLLAQADERISALDGAAARRESSASSGQKASGAPPRRPASMIEPSRPHPELDPIASQVYQLADEGRTPVQIAAALEEHVGKVELILALRGL